MLVIDLFFIICHDYGIYCYGITAEMYYVICHMILIFSRLSEISKNDARKRIFRSTRNNLKCLDINP